ncbi:MAG: RecX family transcriptional regulator [Bacteroidales bacterium]|nr:RecX family transcriptional regulator [Bacteroidales bacterium]
MEKNKRNSDTYRTLLDKARRYCALAEQCEDAVRQKLVTWGATPAESNDIVDTLYSENYLDDVRYARAYCESKILHQHWGRQKVLYQLRLKHLPRAAVEAGMAVVIDDDYLSVLSELAEKKLSELHRSVDDNTTLRQKLTAFLLSRGFLIGEINQITTNILQQ